MFAAWRAGASTPQPQQPAPSPQPLLTSPARTAFLSLLARNIQETTQVPDKSWSAGAQQQSSVTGSAGSPAAEGSSLQVIHPTHPSDVASATAGTGSQPSAAEGSPPEFQALASALAQHAAATKPSAGRTQNGHRDGFKHQSLSSLDSRAQASRHSSQLDPSVAAAVLSKATHFSLLFSTERVGSC
jgi:hypothetical protein